MNMRISNRILSFVLCLVMLVSMMPANVFANEEYCPHTNAYYTEPEGGEPTCFEPAMGGYWFCEDCWNYLDEEKTNVYWDENEVRNAVKKPATGHYFNTDTGVCDECGIPNPVYTKVTSLDDVNEEDMYIIVAEVEGEESTMYFVLGGLDERHPDEQGNVWCPDGVSNAIRVTANADGSISLVNQEVLEDGSPSEFMLDVNPEQFGDMSWLGLTTLMLKLPNQCVYPFQSYSYDNNGYMGVSRSATEYGMWDSSEWIIDFYTTVVTDDTYRYEDEFGSKTHAQQVADGNIGDNIAEGDLLLYKASFYSVGGAMFTLRLREYNGQYYFICGEDWALDGVGDQYYDESTGMWRQYTNDTQYAVSLYRYDVPTVDTHTCEFTNWTDNNDGTHTGACECGKTETESHDWGNGVETKAPACTEEGIKTYTCTKCTATKTESIDALDHDWSTWTDDGANAATDTHTRTCQREGCNVKETGDHGWSTWQPDGSTNHKKTCSVCSGTRTDTHKWNDGVVTTEPTEDAEGVKTYTCSECGHTKTEPVDKLEHVHSWSDWGQNDDDTHIRSCRCNETQTEGHHFDDGVVINWATHIAPGEIWFTCADCGYVRSMEQPILKEHEWGKWNYNNDGTHTRSCICNETETKDCTWDDGVVTKQPTHYEEGVKTYTCSVCTGTKTEAIAKTTEHEWSDWADNNDGTHTRSCRCNANETKDCTYDDGVVTEQPTHTEKGVKTYTCTVCGHTYDEEIPVLTDHAWGEWVINKLDEANTHIRYCVCNESQTAPHNFDEGKVTTEATHTSKGVKTFTCTDGCGYSYTEEIPETTEHQWTNWSPNADGTHTRSCRCNATETKDCTYDAGVVTTPSTHYEEGVKTFTCTVCGHTKTEAVAKTTEHEWSDWARNNDGRTHTHECKCGETETVAHNWSTWTEEAAGGFKRTCADCGAFETMTLDEEKPVNTTTNDNAANTNLTNTDIELIEKVLTDEEQSQVAEGAEVKVYLKVEDISNGAPVAHKAEAEAKAGDNEIGMYLDIDLFKQVGTAAETPVTETSGKVAITIIIPENLINTDASVTRTYKIIRVHEDANGQLITDVIEGVFNPDDNSFTFETDKFSTYALTYADETANNNNPGGSDIPQTGDDSMIALWIVLQCISGLGLAATMALRKKRMF